MLKVKTISPTQNVLFRGLPALMLIIALGAPAAQAADDITATITVYAPGATQGAPVWVEYQDALGNWTKVDGWLGTLDKVTDVGVPYKKWAVFQANFGQGPFRWVVLSADGKTVWGISDSFSLPPGGGIELAETIVPSVTGTVAAAASATPAATATAPAATPTPSAAQPANTSLLLNNTGSSTFGLASDSSVISGYFMGLPSSGWIAVQWGDGLGHWETVQGWQGNADSVDATTGQLFQQWAVASANFGQGPFRWAVFDRQGGTLLGYSASFTLPSGGGQNLYMSLSK